MFDPLRNDPRFRNLAVRKRENGIKNFSDKFGHRNCLNLRETDSYGLTGFRISHLSVPADMFAPVALEDGHNLDPSRYP
jgi:hypothetical protein